MKPAKAVSQTPSELLITQHYEDTGVLIRQLNGKRISGWDRPRFYRLCRMLNATPREIGAIICLSPAALAKRIARDRFEPSEGLHLSLLESCFLKLARDSDQKPVVPMNLLKKETNGAH